MFFSLLFLLAPLSGLLFGVRSTSLFIFLFKLGRYFLFGLHSIFTGIPTLVAAWCWSLENDEGSDNFFLKKLASFFVNVLIPLFCFFIFIFHDLRGVISVGCGWWYALYWFIPVLLYLFQMFGFLKKNIFAIALRSTFIAHAVGSIIWLFTVPMSPEKWLALIPIVAIERFTFAGIMVIGFYGINKISKFFSFSFFLKKSFG